MRLAEIKTFVLGAVAGAVVGAVLLGPVVHLLSIGDVVVGAAAALHRGRRLALAKPRDDKQLNPWAGPPAVRGRGSRCPVCRR